MTRRAVPLLLALACTACQLAVAPGASGPGASAAPGASKAPAKASAAPSDSPIGTSSGAPTAAPGEPTPRPSALGGASPLPATTPSAGPLVQASTTPPKPAGTIALPKRLAPPMPASLVAAAGLIGQDGATLIGHNGAVLVGQGGGALIGQDGASLAGKPPAGYALRGAPPSMAEAIKIHVGGLLGAMVVVQDLLTLATSQNIPPNKPFTIVDDGNKAYTPEQRQLPENKLTFLITPLADHARIAVYRGPAVDAKQTLAVVSFTGPTKGRALLADPRPTAAGERLWCSMAFDLDAGQTTGDIYTEDGNGVRNRVHAVMAAIPDAPAPFPTFTYRMGGYGKNPPKKEDGQIVLSANFRDEGCAATLAFRPAEFLAMLGEGVVFLPTDGSEPTPLNNTPHGFYLDPAGKDLAPASASAALKAMLPTDTDFQKPFIGDPTKPADHAQLADPLFQFPD